MLPGRETGDAAAPIVTYTLLHVGLEVEKINNNNHHNTNDTSNHARISLHVYDVNLVCPVGSWIFMIYRITSDLRPPGRVFEQTAIW